VWLPFCCFILLKKRGIHKRSIFFKNLLPHKVKSTSTDLTSKVFMAAMLVLLMVENLLSSHFLSRNLKIQIYKAIILRVVLYDVEHGLSH